MNLDSAPIAPRASEQSSPTTRWGWPFKSIRQFRKSSPHKSCPAQGEPGSFENGTFANAGDMHAYKLYVPRRVSTNSSLIVMLHGCGQTPADFALGTGMNAHADEMGLFVLYPEQPRSANSNGCWNWFKPEHQQRGRGEPAWIAALTNSVARRFGIDRGRVFIAGLSAGGTMAATVANAYPGLYAGCCVHSGLSIGSAENVIGALSTMRRGIRFSVLARRRPIPTIVFHGRADETVHPSHAQRVIDSALGGGLLSGKFAVMEVPPSSSTPEVTRTVYLDASGARVAEFWDLHAVGHAWSGGDIKGTHTEPRGPNASVAMLQFFSECAVKR